MEMDGKAEKLAQARKKLREFQSKHQKGREDNSSPSPSVSSTTETNGRRSVTGSHSGMGFTHDEKKSPFERVPSLSHSSRSSTTTPAITTVNIEDDEGSIHYDHRTQSSQQMDGLSHGQGSGTMIDYITEQNGTIKPFTNAKEDYNQMARALNEAVMEKNRLTSQLAELAMSVLVKEKTSLQHQLREATEANEQHHQHIQSVEAELSQKTNRLLKAEAEVISLKREVDSLNAVVQREAEELDSSRREAANWQARVLHIQQDRNDAQERLKLCMKESEVAQLELQEARKQLHLKEIYLRQLGAYNAGPAFSEDDIQTLQDENERLKEEITKLGKEKEQLKQETLAAKEHYEAYGTQLNQNVLQISAKLEEVSNERLSLLSRVECLEDELEVIRAEEKKRKEIRGSTEENLFETVHLRKELSEMSERMAQMEKDALQGQSRLADKDSEISRITGTLQNLQSELSSKMLLLAKTEEALAHAKREGEQKVQFNEDVLSLSEQLQNEKATVSRAVAQNRELKEQLIELQDKLVALSQESMERESGRLTALHTIEQLQMEIERLKWRQMEDGVEAHEGNQRNVDNEDNHADDERSNEQMSIEQRDGAIARAEEARIRAEQELVRVNVELNQMRSEHRRVTQQNHELRRIMEQNAEDENQNSIHVELGQAVERINALSGENERLRERIHELEESNQRDGSPEIGTETPPELTGVVSQPQVANISSPQMETAHEVNGNEETTHNTTNMMDGMHANVHIRMPSISEKPLAWTELEARFARAMRQNADLIEQNERLEHVILQLQCENDTIGEYVTIYHHQRKLIRDRMREKEEAVARLSLEKEQMQQKLSELQETLMNVLTKKGILHSYDQERLRRKKKDVPGAIAKRANKLRSFSHSTVDEFSGDEETVVDGTRQIVPEAAPEAVSRASSRTSSIAEVLSSVEVADLNAKAKDVSNMSDDADEDLGVQRILNLITELKDIERGRLLPPCDPKMHCRECRGKLITL